MWAACASKAVGLGYFFRLKQTVRSHPYQAAPNWGAELYIAQL